eukprot:TRINITY_DN30938_c0_g1_i1.p1 TRINITY_DN30938_c0_g1~~TRINITY_DN30938_c0_g1_i1.p1  ORF type:complete len:142 (-),score=14.71 TRINITY_DN30938_c0_g1_i1:1-426(-)
MKKIPSTSEGLKEKKEMIQSPRGNGSCNDKEDNSKVTLLHLIQSGLVPVGSLLSCISEDGITEHAKLTVVGTIICQKSNTEFKTLTGWVTSLFPNGKGCRSGWFYVRYNNIRLCKYKRAYSEVTFQNPVTHFFLHESVQAW